MRVVVLLLFALVTCSLAHNDKACGWELRPSKGYPPMPRDQGAMFYRNGKLYVFGGYTEVVAPGYNDVTKQVFMNDFFSWNVSSGEWQQILPLNSTSIWPPARALFCGVYDSTTDSFYVSGGVDYTSDFTFVAFYFDTWKYSFATKQWYNLTNGVTPPALGGMACDSDDQHIWWSGGATIGAEERRYPRTDLWKYTISTNTWSQEYPNFWPNCTGDYTTCVTPYPRQQHAISVVDGNILLYYGTSFSDPSLPGEQVTIPLKDVWVYTTSTKQWSKRNSIDAPDRDFGAFTKLQGSTLQRGSIILRGGENRGNFTTSDVCDPAADCDYALVPKSETYVYDIPTGIWSQLEIGDGYQSPPNRKGMITSFVPSDRHSNNPLKNNVVCSWGGTDFYGFNGIGSIRNPYMWCLDEIHIF
jgi:hypothetical protein